MSYDHDSDVERGRISRFLVFVATVIAAVGFPTMLGMALGNALDFFGGRFLFGTLGFGIGVFVMLKIFHRFWIVVTQTMAFVTTNQFSPKGNNPNIPYGPGGHFAFPWELRAESGNITLGTLTISFLLPIPTKTSEVTVYGSLQFKFNFPTIVRVVELDPSAIQDGFTDMIKEFLSEEITGKTAEEARHHIVELRGNIVAEFQTNEARAEELLNKFNALVQGVQVSSIVLPPDVQKTRDAIEEARAIGENIWLFMGFLNKAAFDEARKPGGTITQADVNRATEQFLAASDNAKLEIRRIDATGLERAGPGAAIVAGLAGGNRTLKE